MNKWKKKLASVFEDPSLRRWGLHLAVALALLFALVIVHHSLSVSIDSLAPETTGTGDERPGSGGFMAAMYAVLIGWTLVVACGVLYLVYVWRTRKAADEEASDRAGPYTLEKKIGQGGMGEVYLASHDMIRRSTAVKLMRETIQDDQAAARFEREVQLSCKLSHPNTISIYDYGRMEGGVFYYAMEYIDGRSLHDLIKNHGRQCEARVAHILRQICGSLQEAHDLGIIHRDIKASNIMICRRGGMHDVVKLLDFGLAKEVNQAEPLLTSDGLISGTAHYLSPEAIRTPESVDARSDIYAVGALAYYLLTGTRVFTGTSATQILRDQLDRQPERPSNVVGYTINPELEAIVLKCLAKSPDDRPASGKAMIDWLDSCYSIPKWTEQHGRMWWRHYADQDRHQEKSSAVPPRPTPNP